MKEKFNLTFCSEALESKLQDQVIGKLFLNNSCFLVFETNEEIKSILGSSYNSLPESCRLKVVGNMEVNEKFYVITEFPEISNTIRSNLAGILTERELQIVTLVALGWSNKLIAKQLEISEWTVSAHLRRIFVKLNVDTRAAMVYQCAPLIQQLQYVR